MLTISILVNDAASFLLSKENSVKDNNDMPGHLAAPVPADRGGGVSGRGRRCRFDLTPYNTRRLRPSKANPGLDQVTLAGLIAYDRTTITGVDRSSGPEGSRGTPRLQPRRRARELEITDEGKRTLRKITPAVDSAQRIMLRGLNAKEGEDLMRLLHKAIAAGTSSARAAARSAGLAGIRVRNCRSAVKPGTNLRLLPSAQFGA